MHSILADIDLDNVASIRIAEKAGFKKEKVMKDEYRTATKGLRDLVVYRLLRPKLYAAETKRLLLQGIDVKLHLKEIHALNSDPKGMEWS